MKTFYSYLQIIGAFSFFLFTINLNANPKAELPNPEPLDIWDTFYDYTPYSYAARIKRFHRPYQGFNYFSPAYIDLNNYSTILTLGVSIYNDPIDEYGNIKDWYQLHGNLAVYRYYQDKTYRQRVDMWNRINNPNWRYLSSFGGFNHNYGFGLAGNPNMLYHCSALSNFYAYGNTQNEYLNAVLYGQTSFSNTSKLEATTNTQILKPRLPTTELEPLNKKIKTVTRIASVNKSNTPKEDFYTHVTLRTKKRLPKNWRILPDALRAWYESPDLAPPSKTYPDAIKYTSRNKNYKRGHSKSSMSNTGIWDSSPQFGGGGSTGIMNTSSNSPTGSGNINN